MFMHDHWGRVRVITFIFSKMEINGHNSKLNSNVDLD